MLSLDDLSENVSAYKSGRMTLEQLENWFEDNLNGAYDDGVLGSACIAVDAAFSQYHFDHIGETALKQELANAVRPFALQWKKVSDSIFVLRSASSIETHGTGITIQKPLSSEALGASPIPTPRRPWELVAMQA